MNNNSKGTTKKVAEQFLTYAAFGLAAYGIMSTEIVRNLTTTNIHIVSRDTRYVKNPNYRLGSSLPIGEYAFDVTLQNTGRAGQAYFYVVQNENQIVCRDQFYMNSGERRSFTLKCKRAKDGKIEFIASNRKRHS